jgi:hypothetical protein
MIPHAALLMLAASLMLKNAQLAHCQFIDFEYEATKFLWSLRLAILPPTGAVQIPSVLSKT